MDVLDPSRAALATELHTLAAVASYFPEKKDLRACFELGFATMPPGMGVILVAGLDQVVEYLQEFRFTDDDLVYLRNLFIFKDIDDSFWDWLGTLRFTGDLWAVPEGTPVFAGEPVLRVQSTLSQALLLESYLLATISYQSQVATSTARMVHAAQGRKVVEAGLRWGHGPAAGVLLARAAYLAGAAGTTNAEAGGLLGVAVHTAMEPAWVASFATEDEAFKSFAKACPAASILTLDTYDPVAAAKRLSKLGIPVDTVCLEADDLVALSTEVRRVLDKSGYERTKIMARGDLHESAIARLVAEQAPIDSFVVGAALAAGVQPRPPEARYELVACERDGQQVPVAYRRGSELNWPGIKQTFRSFDSKGRIKGDTIGLADEKLAGAPMLQPALEQGRLVFERPGLESIRQYTLKALQSLPERALRGTGAVAGPSRSPGLEELRAELAAEQKS